MSTQAPGVKRRKAVRNVNEVRQDRISANIGRRPESGMLSRSKTFCIVKWRQSTVVRAADVLTPAPGQGEGWGGGRNSVGAVPAFDPHPSLSCRPRRARGSTRRQACWVHRTQARPAAAPARGKEHFPLAAALTTCRASNTSPRNMGPARGLARAEGHASRRTAQVNPLPPRQDWQGAEPQRRIAVPAPGCGSHCNEGRELPRRRFGPQTRRPTLLPTRSPTRPMWPIVGASVSSRQSRPLSALRAERTLPMQRPPRRFSPTRFTWRDQRYPNGLSFVARQENTFHKSAQEFFCPTIKSKFQRSRKAMPRTLSLKQAFRLFR